MACPSHPSDGHIRHNFFCPCKGKRGGNRPDAGRPKKNVPHDDPILEAKRLAMNEAHTLYTARREEYGDAWADKYKQELADQAAREVCRVSTVVTVIFFGKVLFTALSFHDVRESDDQ